MDLNGIIIAVDFDSTIAHYSGWKGTGVFGDPIQGVQWALGRFRDMGAMIIVHTCRSETKLVNAYLKEHAIPFDYVNYSPRNRELKLSWKKIAADIYIDDKGLNFSGSWPETYKDAVNFVPWGKRYEDKAIRS